MPTYEYRCDKCGQQFEVVQSFKDRPLRRHRSCGGSLEKVFHPRGVVFKGSGFYVTDSRPKPASAKNGAGGETVSNGEAKPKKTEKLERTEKTAVKKDTAKVDSPD